MLRCYKNPSTFGVNDKRGPEIEISLSIFKNSVYSGPSNWCKINGHDMTDFHILYIYINYLLQVLISVKISNVNLGI